eukprot:CAMPEP_0178524518 /NCGR_PEP_ID=MMETSP0696-20121128/29687_1 /TAXON_ID=265572 /ORGANISM="Extubocellulus spinifer, Strain CCMP396" /LENGTH=485 /DNA_ID=CAMNT_0020155861 /DNA_START=142 /DNA_END=1598 /DNA_ORIENTATION=+
MQPSFKDGRYDTKVAFTKSAVVACACSCKAGADCKKKDQKHVDVHILPIMHLLVLLLFDGLAEHILIELAARWKSVDDSVEARDTMMDAIETLNLAARSRGGRAPTERSSDATVSKLLDGFLVGTERPKKTPAPPHPRSLCPLAAQKKFVSYVKKGEDAIANISQNDSTLTQDHFAEARKQGPYSAKKTPAPPHPRSLCPLAAQKKFVSYVKKGEDAIANISQNDSTLTQDHFAEARKQGPYSAKKTPAPPHPRSLCPLAAQKKFVSYVKKGEDAIANISQNDSTLTQDHFAEARKQGPYYNRLCNDPKSEDYTSDEKPEYFRAECMVSAWTKFLKSDDKSHEDPVGYKLQHVTAKSPPIRRSSPYHNAAKYTRYCCFPECGRRGAKGEANKFRPIPSVPPAIPADASDARKMTYAKKKFIREENLRRCSYSMAGHLMLYICRDHLREDVKKSVSFTNRKGERKSFTVSINVPVPIGRSSVRLGP